MTAIGFHGLEVSMLVVQGKEEGVAAAGRLSDRTEKDLTIDPRVPREVVLKDREAAPSPPETSLQGLPVAA